jgi:hypothetical protein
MDELRKAGMLAKGAKGNPRGRGAKIVRVAGRPTLSDQGIDKNLADRARKAAAMTEKQFKVTVARAIKLAVAAIDGPRDGGPRRGLVEIRKDAELERGGMLVSPGQDN